MSEIVKCVNCGEEIYYAENMERWRHTRTRNWLCRETFAAPPEPAQPAACSEDKSAINWMLNLPTAAATPPADAEQRAREGTPELKCCPFCGQNKAAWGEGEQKTKYGNEQVYCSWCYAMTAPEMTKEEAAENWNARVTLSATEVEMRVRAAVAEMFDLLPLDVYERIVKRIAAALSAPDSER